MPLCEQKGALPLCLRLDRLCAGAAGGPRGEVPAAGRSRWSPHGIAQWRCEHIRGYRFVNIKPGGNATLAPPLALAWSTKALHHPLEPQWELPDSERMGLQEWLRLLQMLPMTPPSWDAPAGAV